MIRGDASGVFLAGTLFLFACGSGKSVDSAQAPITGSWQGSIAGVGPAVGVRMTVTDDNGALTGQLFYEDRKTGDFVQGPSFTGSRQGSDATWRTVTGVVVSGKVDATGFAGTIQFPLTDAAGNDAPYAANLSLKR